MDKITNPTKIIVGVNFDSHTDSLVRYVTGFVNKTGTELRLTHAIDRMHEYYWLNTYYGSIDFYAQLVSEQREIELKEARSKMESLLQSASVKNLKTESNILVANPTFALLADAERSHASLIVVGTTSNRSQLFPSGLSTSLSLMSQASLPVMAVPHDAIPLPQNRKLRILYADDLGESTTETLSQGIELCSHLGESEFFHVHICETSKDEIKKTGKRVLELMNAKNIPFDDLLKSGDFVSKAHATISAKLAKRAEDTKVLLQPSHSAYLPRVYFGKVDESLHTACEEIQPDVLVFGRHQNFHHHPFSMGKIPFSMMLNNKIPVIVLPIKKIPHV